MGGFYMLQKREVPLFLQISLLFGLKTYIVYRVFFQLEIENILQHIILFINPFIVSFIFFSLSAWFRTEKNQHRFLKYSALIGTIVIYSNIVFYRSFTDFITIPQLFQVNNALDLTSSVFSLIKWYDIFIFLDVWIVWRLCKKDRAKGEHEPFSKRFKKRLVIIFLLLLSVNFLLAEIERPQLLSRGFDREYIVKNLGIFYFHLYDVAIQSKMRSQRIVADETILEDVQTYLENEVRSNEPSALHGIAKDRNIFFISAESIQNFVVNETLHGEEITPFLNQLTENEDTFYFNNFYHQTGQGKTSDSEFIIENSLYPLPSGAVFFTHAQNEYNALSHIMQQLDYKSYVFHANNQTFWNRNQIYEKFFVDQYFDKEFYDVDETNEVGWGLKDKPFFEQTIPYLQDLDQPFYAKLITITNHFPFDLDEEDRTLEPYDSNSNTVNNYFPTVRYMDEAIELFFDLLKDAGLYDNSVIIIMGDHDGISATHNKAMAQFYDKEEITPYDYFELQKVPFFIHIPGYGKGETVDKLAGQLDVKPTILHMLGIDTSDDVYFGNDLFHDDRKAFIAFRNGNFTTEDYIYANGVCYDRKTEDVLAEDHESKEDNGPCTIWKEKVDEELELSDQIIYGDLIRFLDEKENE